MKGNVQASPAESPIAHAWTSSDASVVDYNLHGILGVRLIGATAADQSVVENQIGTLRSGLRRPPDITIRFVDRIPTDGLRYVEVGRSGFTERDFLIRSNGRRAAWVRVPFETLGDPSEFVCERGVRLVPLLKPALRLAAVRKGYVPFHASGFEWQGSGVLVTGWAHGGKTSALLAFAGQGARFVGDELVLLSADGRAMAGLPGDFRLTDRQLEQLPHLHRGPGARHRLAVAALRGVQRLTSPRGDGGVFGARPLRLINVAAREAEARLKTHVATDALFPAGSSLRAEPRCVFLMTSREGAGIDVVRTPTREIANRMMHSLRYENLPLLSQYVAFRFAFPKRRNLAIETMHDAEAALLPGALARLGGYAVHHPYPVPFRALFDAMRPFCAAEAPTRIVARELALQ